MFYKMLENVYFENNKYTFKDQVILDNNLLVYCFVAVSDGAIHCLLQGFNIFTNDKKDKAIKDYLKNKKRLMGFKYKNTKPLIEITSYKVGK